MTLKTDTHDLRTSSLGWMIQRLARYLDQEMDARLKAHGLTLQQFAVLMTALETDGLSQTAIGEKYGMPPYAISRAIDQLVRQDLLQRRQHPTSRRTHTIHATETAEALSGRLFAIVREVNDGLAQPLSAEERAQFQALLTRLVAEHGAQRT
jgi:DNA-binding MarR family transcriptional regulator